MAAVSRGDFDQRDSGRFDHGIRRCEGGRESVGFDGDNGDGHGGKDEVGTMNDELGVRRVAGLLALIIPRHNDDSRIAVTPDFILHRSSFIIHPSAFSSNLNAAGLMAGGDDAIAPRLRVGPGVVAFFGVAPAEQQVEFAAGGFSVGPFGPFDQGFDAR